MGLVNTVFAGENVLFLVPITVVVGWLGISIFLGGIGEADVDFDVDADGDFDVDGDGDAEVHGNGFGVTAVLGALGAGHVPFLLWLQMLTLLWGSIGLSASLLGSGQFFAAIGATATAPIATAAVSRGVARLLPNKNESEALSLRQCIGLSGRVVSTKVDQAVGEGAFEGPHATTLYLPIRIEESASVIAEHSSVVIVDVDEVNGLAIVTESELLALIA